MARTLTWLCAAMGVWVLGLGTDW
ncbi:hypothetical protein CCACVL1_10836 [Corchorus capsularis]|uniref:Uncharacterized protein n=1 Tax=Corchorus capsularis TaxID=210143 RepID=A0A1R3IPA2_COCAP|nr:hypothetical protein CCACVL1_10836 [Corchorus capsularis]